MEFAIIISRGGGSAATYSHLQGGTSHPPCGAGVRQMCGMRSGHLVRFNSEAGLRNRWCHRV